MKYYKNKQLNKGAVSVLLALLILGGLLIIGSGVSVLMIQQIKMSSQAGRSVVALYAADAGAEECLYQIRRGTGAGCDSGEIISGWIGDAYYEVEYDSESHIITSLGQFEGVNRKFQLNF